jgi:YD repeat-containing protein
MKDITSWDATGNRTGQIVGSTLNTYNTQSGSNKIQSISAGTITKTYSHDNNGNLTSDGTYTFSYDSNNRLTEAKLGTTIKGSYTYNGLGQRVRKTAATNVQFVYDEAGQLIGEYNGTTTIRDTIYLGDMPLITINNGVIYYIHTDHLNTPRRISDASKKLRWTWDNSTFGATAPNEKPTSKLAALKYNYRFPVQYSDGEMGN